MLSPHIFNKYLGQQLRFITVAEGPLIFYQLSSLSEYFSLKRARQIFLTLDFLQVISQEFHGFLELLDQGRSSQSGNCNVSARASFNLKDLTSIRGVLLVKG